jgi:anti-sigma B factor antagonist
VTEERTTVQIAGDFTVQTAAENKAVLVSALGSGQAVDVDRGNVAEIDTAGIQLLLLAKREAAELAVNLRLVSVPRSVLEILEIVGLDAYLEAIATDASGVSQVATERTP